MSKVELKKRHRKNQNGECALSGVALADETRLFDTDRKTEKYRGGTYDDETNVRAVEPVAHMKRHGNYRERSEDIAAIKKECDARRKVMQTLNSDNNRLLAYERNVDELEESTVEWLNERIDVSKKKMADMDKRIARVIKKSSHPVIPIARKVKGLESGFVTIAHMLAYIDIRKTDSVSSMWQYVGLDRSSRERYTPNPQQQARREARGPEFYGSDDRVPTGWGGNKTLRTVLYTFAVAQVKMQPDPSKARYSPYREVYDRAKFRKSISNATVESRNTQGKLITCKWKDAKPCHRHGHALRMVIKHFLSDWWFAHRTVEGLDTRPIYVEEKLRHTGIIDARERGWQF